MESIAHKIENRIKGFGRGKIFFADDFLDFGSSDAIRQTLLRLTKSGVIIRVWHRAFTVIPKLTKLWDWG